MNGLADASWNALAPAASGRAEDGVRDAAQRLWLAHLRGDVSPRQPAPTVRQWAYLEDEAARHELHGLTYRLLSDGPLAGQVPRELDGRLRSAYVDTATRNALAFRHISHMAKDLAATGIEVMLLKGVHLARFVYAEPGLRNMADVDIMVRRPHLAEAEQVFLARGFGPVPRPDIEEFCTRSNHLARLFKDGAPVVEVHWSIERPTSPFPIDPDGLWARSRGTTLGGVPFRLLSPEDLLLHLSLHESYHHRFDRSALKGMVDIHAVVARHAKEIDWQALTERARLWGASGFVYTTLRLAVEILGTPVPATVFDALPHRRADEKVIDVARRYILVPRPVLPRPYLELVRSRTLRERWRLLVGNVFLSRQDMERVYGLDRGTPLVYACYGRRLASLLLRRSGLLLRALMGSRDLSAPLDREEDRLRIEDWVGGRAPREEQEEEPMG